MTSNERKKATEWLERLKAASRDSLTKEQKEAIVRYSRHVVWKKVDDDFNTILPK